MSIAEETQALIEMAQRARAASRRMASLSTKVKNEALGNIATALIDREAEILAANATDMAEARAAGLDDAMLDRLMLNDLRLHGMASDVRAVMALPDPVGETFEMRTLPNGLQVGRRRIPLGVVGVIYESRPNVTVDISVLCLKSGNAVILRGGKEAFHSNHALAAVVQDALAAAGIPAEAVQMVASTDRALVGEMLKLNQYIDIVVPRGGAGLVKFVGEHATMPAITGGIGVCHTYVDAAADLEKALAIVNNAKTRRCTICNALDTVLVHSAVAEEFLTGLAILWSPSKVEMRCEPRALGIVEKVEGVACKMAVAQDYGQEFLALRASVKVVDSLDEAIAHIAEYGSGHSEAIVTEDYTAAMRFLNEVDAAAVYVNASTQFTDGAQFGLGAEIGISTGRLHARGPMGLREMTTYKWVILGSGQIRPV